MQICNKCGITIRGNKKCCPLCEGKLTGEPEDPAFPVVKRKRLAGISPVKMGVFLFLAFEIVMMAMYYLSDFLFSWIPLSMLAGLVAIVDVLLLGYLHNNILKTITIQTYIGMVICYVVDRLTGYHAWSVVWVFPFAFVGLVIATISVGKGLGMLLGDYVIYLVVDVLLSLTQAIFIALDLNPLPFPAVIIMALLALWALAGLFFRFRTLKNASAKMFHV